MTERIVCPDCKGMTWGFAQSDRYGPWVFQYFWYPCQTCGGSGKVPKPKPYQYLERPEEVES